MTRPLLETEKAQLRAMIVRSSYQEVVNTALTIRDGMATEKACPSCEDTENQFDYGKPKEGQSSWRYLCNHCGMRYNAPLYVKR